MKFFQLTLKYPRSVIAAIVVITLFFGWQMRKVQLNNSIEELLPENHPSVLQDREIKNVFNSREMILIGVINEKGIFNPATLRKVKELTDKIWQVTIVTSEDEQRLREWGERLDNRYSKQIRAILSSGINAADRGVVSNLLVEARNDPAINLGFTKYLKLLQLKLSPISDVISLSDVDNITSTEWGINVDPPMEEVPNSQEELAQLASTVFNNEMFVNGLVSQDSSGTAILAELSFYYDDHLDMAYQVFNKLNELTIPYKGPENIQLAGVPMVNVYTSNYMSGDLAKLTPIVILLVMIVMYLSFRMLKGVFIPLSVVLVALVWTLGVMGILNRPITLVVSAMPVMLIAIGIADGIHLITEYKLLWAKFRDKEQAILGTMKQLYLPVIFTSLTTMAGFASLATSSLRSIKDFGIFTSVGVFAAMLFSLTFVPAALRLMKPPKDNFGTKKSRQSWIGAILQHIGAFAVSRRRWVYVGTIVLAGVSIFTILEIKVGSTMVGYFHEDSEIYQASQMLNSKFGGTEVMNIVIDTKVKDGLKDPEVLGKIAALQDTLEALPVVGYSTSIADYVKRINFVMNNEKSSFNRIPGRVERVMETEWVEENGREREVEREIEISGRDQIAQYLLLYENAGGEYLEKLADYDYSKANIIVQIRSDYTPTLRKVRQIAKGLVAANFAGNAEVNFAGCSSLCIVADDLIIPSQLKSLGIALAVVLVLLSLIFRSVKHGIIGLLPLILTILFVFALMSLFGVHLDAVTALVASIVLGIGVDYSVHFLSRYRSLRKEGKEFAEAIHETMDASGRAIVFNSIGVALGFSVLLLSSFWPVMHIGWLVAANMMLSAFLTMALIPAVLRFRILKLPEEVSKKTEPIKEGERDEQIIPHI